MGRGSKFARSAFMSYLLSPSTPPAILHPTSTSSQEPVPSLLGTPLCERNSQTLTGQAGTEAGSSLAVACAPTKG